MVGARVLVRRGQRAGVALCVLSIAWGAAPNGVAVAKVPTRTTCSVANFLNDRHYGPKRLPNAGLIAPMLKGYRRFGGMAPRKYLRKYFTPGQGWDYPPEGGYQIAPDGQVVKMQLSLFAGQQVDVFGTKTGLYLAPAGTPYAARSIPPQTLDSRTNPGACNYVLYDVLQTFPVQSGPIAPGLGQPGFGLQYVLDSTIFPGQPSQKEFNIGYLVDNGYLEQVFPAMRSGRRAAARGAHPRL